ncbi:MAG: type II toxin-antitoxin system Phd/YefM family antitoxin [Clostridiales Family XIII bacterium]|jgi:prevent-host-death family protein|nr:type II toxin-antitoxin system Phd/YefM family antitoxin [Clostridiales Family XIII bacterium]
MEISVSELKEHAGKYVKMADQEDVYITIHGRTVAKLTSAKGDKVAALERLRGCLPSTLTDEDVDRMRFERIWNR